MRLIFKILIIAVIVTLIGIGLILLYNKKLYRMNWVGILGITMVIAGLILAGVCFAFIRLDIFTGIIENRLRR